jgi:hypothetical protein
MTYPLQKCCVPYCDKTAVIEVGEALYCSGHALDRERAMLPRSPRYRKKGPQRCAAPGTSE